MTRLNAETTPSSKASQLLDGIQKKLGRVPNIFKLMSLAPNVLEGYLQFSGSLDQGTLSAQDVQHIALVVAGYDHCTYCASAHTLMARKEGIASEEATQNLKAQSSNTKTTALLKFCREILQNKGNVSDAGMKEIREAGYTDAQIVEIVAVVCANIFTNYFNHVADTEVDFPKVELT